MHCIHRICEAHASATEAHPPIAAVIGFLVIVVLAFVVTPMIYVHLANRKARHAAR